MGAVCQIVRIVYVRQRTVLVAITEVCDATATTGAAATAHGARTKHTNVRTATTTAAAVAAAAAAIPIICRTSQGFRENGGSGAVVRQLSVLLQLLRLVIQLRVDRGTDTDGALGGHCTRRLYGGWISRARDDGGRQRNRRRTRRSMYNTRTTTALRRPSRRRRWRKQIIHQRRHDEMRTAQFVCPRYIHATVRLITDASTTRRTIETRHGDLEVRHSVRREVIRDIEL